MLLYKWTKFSSQLNPLYATSRQLFLSVVEKALSKAGGAKPEELIGQLTQAVHRFVTAGMSPEDRLVASARLAFVTVDEGKGPVPRFWQDWMLPRADTLYDPVPVKLRPFLKEERWTALKMAGQEGPLSGLCQSLETDDWKGWLRHGQPESQAMPFAVPQEHYRVLALLHLRPDRLAPVLRQFVATQLGAGFSDCLPAEVPSAVALAGPATPILVLQGRGLDLIAEIQQEAAGQAIGLCTAMPSQGNQQWLEDRLRAAAKEGRWFILHNINYNRKYMDEQSLHGLLRGHPLHPKFRLFLTLRGDDGSSFPLASSCVKLASNAPTSQDFKSHLLAAFDKITSKLYESSALHRELLYKLAYLHALVMARPAFRKWNNFEQFSHADLRFAAETVARLLEQRQAGVLDEAVFLLSSAYANRCADQRDSATIRGLFKAILKEVGCPLLELFVRPEPGLTHAQAREAIGKMSLADCPARYGLAGGEEDSLHRVTCAIGGAARDQADCLQMASNILRGLPAPFTAAELEGLTAAGTQQVILQECLSFNHVIQRLSQQLGSFIGGQDDALADCLAANTYPSMPQLE